MDFKSLMAAQISKSKPSSTSDGPKAKYLRRADVEASREAEYAAEQARIEAEREERSAKKRKIEEGEAERDRVREEKKRRLAEESKARREEEEARQERARRKRLGLPELVEDGEEAESTPLGDGEEDIAEDALPAKLRDLGEPAFLFGETHLSRLRRYRDLTGKSLAPKYSNTPIPTTLSLLPESEMAVPSTIPAESDIAGRKRLNLQLASYFTLLLTEWVTALSLRSPFTKSSQAGKQAYHTYASVLSDLTPLFRHFESNSLPNSLIKSITSIVSSMQARRYVEANDKYLQLSIGKAAWPIGVTMVGIHERSAREKLHESEKGKGGEKEAHILSDEVTRKYLQSIKRCLSYAQTRWPPEDVGQLMG